MPERDLWLDIGLPVLTSVISGFILYLILKREAVIPVGGARGCSECPPINFGGVD